MNDIEDGFISKERGPYGISTQTIMLRKAVAQHVQFDEKVTRYQDLDYMLTAMQHYNVYCVPEILVDRSIGDDSITNHPDRTFDMYKYFSQKYSKEITDKSNYKHFFSNALIEAGAQCKQQKKEYKHFLKQACALNPSARTYIKMLSIYSNTYYLFRNILGR